MGLVIQAPLDSVLTPVAPAHPGAAGAAGDAEKVPNGFAAIVNALLGDSKGTAKKDARQSLLDALKQALRADDGDGDADAATGANAVAAALAAMQSLIPTVLTTSSGGAGAEQSVQVLTAADPASILPVAAHAQVADALMPEAASPVTGAESAPAAASTGAALPAAAVPTEGSAPVAQAPETAAVATTDSVSSVAEAPGTTSAPPAEATTPEAAPQATTVQQRTDATATPAANLSAAAAVAEAQGIVMAKTGDSEERPNESRKRDAVDSAASPPGDPVPQTPQDAASVVRFVGNAQSSQRAAENGSSPERKNEPNASVQGIAHAAANSAVGQLRPSDSGELAPTDVPPATPATPGALPPAVERVSQTVIEQIAKGGGEARIHLHPAELGEVVIRVNTDGDHVRVEIHALRAEAMNLLRDHTTDLSNLLGGRGLNLADVFVGLGGQAASDARDQQQAATPNGQVDAGFAVLMGIDESPATDLHNRLRAAYNPDGALSYRI